MKNTYVIQQQPSFIPLSGVECRLNTDQKDVRPKMETIKHPSYLFWLYNDVIFLEKLFYIHGGQSESVQCAIDKPSSEAVYFHLYNILT